MIFLITIKYFPSTLVSFWPRRRGRNDPYGPKTTAVSIYVLFCGWYRLRRHSGSILRSFASLLMLPPNTALWNVSVSLTFISPPSLTLFFYIFPVLFSLNLNFQSTSSLPFSFLLSWVPRCVKTFVGRNKYEWIDPIWRRESPGSPLKMCKSALRSVCGIDLVLVWRLVALEREWLINDSFAFMRSFLCVVTRQSLPFTWMKVWMISWCFFALSSLFLIVIFIFIKMWMGPNHL